MQRDEALVKAFADELRARRHVLRYSQDELAHRAGMNRTYVAKLELAKNQPTLTGLQNLARALGVPLNELLAAVLERRSFDPSSG